MFINFIKRSIVWFLTLSVLLILGLIIGIGTKHSTNMEIESMKKWYVILYILISLIIGIILYKINRNRYFVIALFIVSFILRIIWVIKINSVPVSDFTQMYEGAKNIVNGDINLVKNSKYFTVWVYQLGYTVIQSFIIRIFGSSIIVLKIFNAIISSMIPIVIYFICNKLSNTRGSRVPALIYSFYITSITMTSVLTNQHLATLLIYIGLYLLISKEKNFWFIILGSVVISFGNIIRPEGIVVIIAIVLFYIFKDFQNIKTPKIFIKKNIGKPILIVMVYLITGTLTSFIFQFAGYTDYKLINREPYWKFVVGLNSEHNGLWNEEDGSLVNSYPIGEKRDEFEKKLIIERLKDTDKLIPLMKNKFRLMWCADDWGSIAFSVNYEEASRDLKGILLRIEKIQFIAIVILAFISVFISLFKEKELNSYHLFFILIIGYILVHLIVEIQTRYRYFIIPSMVIISVELFNYLENMLCKKRK